MLPQLPWDKTYLVATWLETLVYGFFVCLFLATTYVHLYLRRAHDSHSQVMYWIATAMFIIATLHISMNCYRLVRAYTDKINDPGGAAAYLSELAPWDHVFKDTLYASQEMFGDAVAIYRTWVIWNRDWRIIVLPIVLLIVSIISGYTVCGLYTVVVTSDTVFDPRLANWITTFYSIAVVQSAITTGLMAYRIWNAEKRMAKYRTSQSNLRPVLWILVESASLQFFVELVLLALYAANYNCQYLMLEPVTPLVGITFTAITLRITLRSHDSTSGHQSTGRGQDQHLATIGSLPMRHIAINITKDVDQDANGTSDGTSYTEMDKKSSQAHITAV
ncbi:hypothetical protein NLI96_g4794 [Meripilus lineatus]|uniref:Uncharacterized protein n=1 Tax=Meripilus lineatus TaxID=2056292 RepID=A0AAD5V3X8_9APHY|nr:hypothetical protein NLI96_g4794 [Physisporinus lineatus]